MQSGAVSAEKISKGDANQLNGSIVWFRNKYDQTCTMTPIMIHPKTTFEFAASPDVEIRIVHGPGLNKMRDAVRAYSVSLTASGRFKDTKEVNKQLTHFKLTAAEIVALCSVGQGAN